MTQDRKDDATKHSVEERERRIAQLEATLIEQDQSRQALLAMLDDLQEGTRKIEHARKEWTDAFDAVRDPIFLHDKDFRIVRANRAYAARAGLDIKDIIGKSYWQTFPKIAGPPPAASARWRKKKKK